MNFRDPIGLVTLYGGLGASAYTGFYGNATAALGVIAYSDKSGWFGGNWASYRAEKAQADCIHTTLGHGAGAGPVFGFFTGALNAFTGPSSNVTLDLGFIGLTYSENSSGWGLSAGVGGKGIGLGYYINTTNTVAIYSGK